MEVLSLWGLVVPACCWASAILFWSCFQACSNPSIAGLSFLAGVAVRVAREEPLRIEDFPKGPFSSGCRRCPRAFGWPLQAMSIRAMEILYWWLTLATRAPMEASYHGCRQLSPRAVPRGSGLVCQLRLRMTCRPCVSLQEETYVAQTMLAVSDSIW